MSVKALLFELLCVYAHPYRQRYLVKNAFLLPKRWRGVAARREKNPLLARILVCDRPVCGRRPFHSIRDKVNTLRIHMIKSAN